MTGLNGKKEAKRLVLRDVVNEIFSRLEVNPPKTKEELILDILKMTHVLNDTFDFRMIVVMRKLFNDKRFKKWIKLMQ